MSKVFLILVLLSYGSVLVAQTAVQPASGDGSAGNPYQIETLDNLYWISQSENEWDKYYIQIADIDASETVNWTDGGWDPIAYYLPYNAGVPFSGKYDGQNHIIDGLYIDRTSVLCIGLFSYTLNATINNLGVTNVDINGNLWPGALVGQSEFSSFDNCFSTGSVSGNEGVAGLISHCIDSNVNNCFSECTMIGFGDYVDHVGGIIGRAQNSNISSCYATGDIIGESSTGGLIGRIFLNTIVENCYSTGSVTGVDDTGGLVGISTYGSQIINSYCTGSVSGDTYIGGLLGAIGIDAGVTNSYSIGSVVADGGSGGLVGDNWDSCTISNSYWNTETSGLTTSQGGEGRTTNDMTYPYSGNTYVDWDFVDTWKDDVQYNVNNGYPFLFADSLISVDEDHFETNHLHLYPNPVRDIAVIEYTMKGELLSSPVKIDIYNAKGQFVESIEGKNGNATLDMKMYPNGVYFYRIGTSCFNKTNKMILLK